MSLCQSVTLLLPAILESREMQCDLEMRLAPRELAVCAVKELTRVSDRQLTSTLEGPEDPFAGWDAWWQDVDLCLAHQGCSVPLYCLGPPTSQLSLCTSPRGAFLHTNPCPP